MSQLVTPGAAAPEAPANPPAETPSAPAAPPKSGKASRADFVKSLNAKLGLGKPTQAPEPTPEPVQATEEPPAETPAETPAEPTPEPVPAKEEPPKLQAHKLAAAQLEAQRAKSDALKAKELLKTHESRVAELEAKIESLKDLKSYLKHVGKDAPGLAQLLLDSQSELADVSKAVERDPEVQALIDEGKKAKEKAAKDAERAQAEALRTENVKLVQSFIDAPGVVDAYPLVAAMPDAASTMLTWIEAGIEASKTPENPDGVEPSFELVAKMLQEETLKETMAYLKHPGARAALLKDPELSKLLKAVEEVAPAAAKPAAAKPTPAPAVETPAPEEPARKRSESPLDAEARKRAKTLTGRMSGAVPSRMAKETSSAELAARLNRDLLGK